MAVSRPLQAAVIVPTFDHGATLRHSVGSALRQTVPDIELVIVGDGMPDGAREVALALERSDERVRFVDNPKGETRGEAHRNAVLREVTAPYVFYLSDDDLWMPEHLATMLATFEVTSADFVHSVPVWRMGDGSWYRWVVDLAQPRYRQLMFEHKNRVPLSCGAHTLESYRRLPHGWRPAPPEHWTDEWMWMQFAQLDGMKFACSRLPTALNFPGSVRAGWTNEQRVSELAECSAILDDPVRRLALHTELFEAEIERLTWLETQAWEMEDWLADRERGLAWLTAERERHARDIAVMKASLRWRLGERAALLRRRLFSRP
jgi:GalNAc5-diNAcBac-PP-undecaprenol beta-1,3-glucosyltransferase